MPSDDLSLLVAGREHKRWESFEIDSDLMIPADAWRVTLGLENGEPPPDVKPGALCELRIAGATVMTGRVDSYEHEISKDSHTLSMSGRDHAAVLVDCAAPIFVAKQTSLEEIAVMLVRDFGISAVKIDADTKLTREKINIEPGDTAWAALSNAAEANGLWPWFTPDGVLMIGGPDYDKPPVATLTLRRGEDALTNNIMSLRRFEDVSDRFSQVTVLGQTHGTTTAVGKHNLKSTAFDAAVTWFRPKIVTDGEADNDAVAQAKGRKLIADARIKGFTLDIKVRGYRAPESNVLWQPGQRVEVISEPHGINGVFFLMGRKFRMGRSEGGITEMRLKEDGVWTLDAHPHKNKHRRGKNSAPGRIVDLVPPGFTTKGIY